MTTPSSETTNNINTTSNTMLGDTNTTSQNDVISFISAGEQPPVEYDYHGISKMLTDTASDQTHDIEQFLKRPVQIGQFGLAKSVSGTDVYAANFLEKIFANVTVSEKLSRFFAMRATFCAKLVVNTMSFHSGLYYFSMRPYSEGIVSSVPTLIPVVKWPAYTTDVRLDNASMLTHLTGFPGSMINLGATSEVTIKVPYVGVTPSINLSSAFNNEIAVTCVSPLADSTNAAQAHAVVYGWLEDVELFGADPWPVKSAYQLTPQSSEGFSKLIGGLAATQGVEADDSRPVSTVAKTVSSIAKKLSTIPIVSDIAGPVSWIADAVGMAGSVFGFSKPNDPKHPRSIANDPLRDMPSGDMPSTATKLTLTKNAGVSVDSLGPTDKDEMAISEIARRQCVFALETWQSSMARGTEIFSLPLTPDYFKTKHSRDLTPKRKQKYTSHTYLSWLASMFLYWRGSLKVTMAFAANQFYSGRLRFVVTLNSPANTAEPVAFDDPGNYGVVYDLRSADTITLTIPFMSVNYWRHVIPYREENVPILRCYVETQLTHASTVADSINIAVMPSGGEDLTFAVPYGANRTVMPYNWVPQPPAQMVKAYSDLDISEKACYEGKPFKYQLQPQGYDTNQTTQQPEQDILMFPGPPDHANVVATTQAIGDPVVSLRTLSKRMSHKQSLAVKKDDIVAIIPFLRIADASPNIVRHTTYLEAVRQIYRFVRGGVRFNIFGLGNKPVHFKLVYRRTQRNIDSPNEHFNIGNGVFVYSKAAGSGFFDIIDNICEFVVREDLRGCASVEVPFYSPHAMLNNMPITTVSAQSVTPLIDLPLECCTDLMLVFQAVEDGNISVYESAADDFTTGYIIGPPIHLTDDDLES